MSPMLPALPADYGSLTALVPSCLAAMRGAPNALQLPAVRSAVIVLADGLGQSNLKSCAGHARFLSRHRRGSLSTVLPSTTAAALASMGTGALPGEHGIVGYRVLDPESDRLVNQLSGWDETMVPERWQPLPTLFETAPERTVMVAAKRYRDTGYSRAVLRGLEFVVAESLDDRVAQTLAVLAEGPALVYCYVPELDMAGHAKGWRSEHWLRVLEELDAAVARLSEALRPDEGLLLTADHGILDVPAHRHLLVDDHPELLEGVRHFGGEPRMLQLYLEAGLGSVAEQSLLEAWQRRYGERAWVFSREQAEAAGFFGTIAPDHRERLGQIMVAARAEVAFYHSQLEPASRGMIGQHGSFSDEERMVPLLGAGAFRG